MRNETKKHLRKNRLGNLIWYDLNYGYRSTRLKWLGAVLVQAYFAIMAARCCPSPEMPVGLPGYVEFLLRGLPEYFVSETGRFELPVPWLMLHAYVLFLTVSYPAEDLARSGGQAIVRAGRRWDWLLGKAAWVVCNVAGYYLLLAGILALCALAAGGPAENSKTMGNPVIENAATESLATKYVAIEDLEPESATARRTVLESVAMGNKAANNKTAGDLLPMSAAIGGAVPKKDTSENMVPGNMVSECVAAENPVMKGAATESLAPERLGNLQFSETGQDRADSQNPGDWEMSLRCLGQSLLVSLTLCLSELMFSLILEPALSLFLMLGYLTASVFWASPAFLGNFSMLLRQDFLSGIPGINFPNCLTICTLWSAAVLALGKSWIRRKDIF